MQLLVLFCLVAGSLAQLEVRDCPANSHFTTCGTACPLTCENYLNPPKVCVLMCNIGCACDEGYVLAKDGSCVLPELCPAQAVAKSCSGGADSGLCYAYMPSYFYDASSGTCERFIYGGCGGNGNRYASEEECLKACAGQRALDRPDCDKKADSGLCNAYFPRYYYDQEEGMCKKFVYGGCGGNRNNFKTEFECYNKCGALFAPKLKLCEQEKVTGPCRAYIPRYFYNTQTGECEKFIYGGCGGNDNSFASKDSCEQVCKA